jgi:hypothetical protein
MAYENLRLSYPNFCIGPQIGTFCTINQDTATTTMLVKNDTGTLISSFTLSSNIINEVVGFEYVGPKDLTGMLDDLTFFTAERVSSTSIVIKRWEVRTSNSTLNLKQQIVKSDTGNYRYNVSSVCFESYERSFNGANPGSINYIDMDSTSRITSGMRLFLGPSNDADNIDATETAIVNYVSGSRVYLLSNLVNQYISGDSISFYKYTYVFSSLGYAGDTTKGSLFQLNAANGNVNSVVYDGLYQGITASRWSGYMSAVGATHANNLVYINPYNYFSNIRSQTLNNLEDDKISVIDLEDIAFSDTAIYKLMGKINLRDDVGEEDTYSWSDYNYQLDTILPYTNTIQIYTDKFKLIGENDTTTLNVKVNDQFGVGLLGVTVQFYRNGGDTGAVFDPVDGQVITDSNGEATIDYTSGDSYEGATELQARATGGSPNTGSQYVWENILVFTNLDAENSVRAYQRDAGGDFSIFSYVVRQINNNWSLDYPIFCRTYFTSPGGNWYYESPNASQVSTYLPHLPVGDDDGPVQSFLGFEETGGDIIPGTDHLLRQVSDASGETLVFQLDEFESNTNALRQIADASHDLQISQLKMSYHTSWVDGIAYTDLFTDVSINQFIFVEDAIPQFWSEKNPKGTNIWIRLRPYAFSLNPATLVFYMREVSYVGDTGYVDMFSYLTINTFDAGGGLLGLDITCDPPEEFHHNGVVYVRIEVYDIAPVPNFIWTYYYFSIVPDYKAPYLENLSPAREQNNVAVNSNVYFEIKDLGAGVDIDTLEVSVNSKIVVPDVTRVDNYHYLINYDPSSNFPYNKTMTVNVKVADLSPYDNYLNDGYKFYTARSSAVWFTEETPGRCTRGVSPYSGVRFVVLGAGDGVDRDTIRLQIFEKDKTNESSIVPIVYRVS